MTEHSHDRIQALIQALRVRTWWTTAADLLADPAIGRLYPHPDPDTRRHTIEAELLTADDRRIVAMLDHRGATTIRRWRYRRPALEEE